MSLRTKAREQAYELHLYRGGRCPVEGLRGLLQAWENIQGHSVSIPDLKFLFKAGQNATSPTTVLATSGRLYGVWALSGALAATAPASTLDAIVQVTDNSVVVASFKVKSNKASEVYFFDSGDGVGITMGTNIAVKAVAATGSGDPANADLPDVVVLYGDDLTNTSDANLINTNYG